MIETRGLCMRYGDLLALDQLSLRIEKGELFAFLGPNGAGKTTTIKLLTGLLRPTEGEALICGFDIQKEPLEAKKRIGYVPDVAEFYDKLTPREFMKFIADLFGVEHKQAGKATEALFDRFSLHHYAEQRIENLSHGTRQRLAISSALLHDPEVIIIDEPMVGLDPHNAKVVKEELKERSQSGATVLMSTHLLSVAEEVADRIGVINEGRLQAVGSLDEIHSARSGAGGRSLEELFLELTAPSPEGEA